MDLRFEQREAPAGSGSPAVRDPAVEAKPARRRFTAAYKLDILS
jgi:hypothetical protein